MVVSDIAWAEVKLIYLATLIPNFNVDRREKSVVDGSEIPSYVALSLPTSLEMTKPWVGSRFSSPSVRFIVLLASIKTAA
jgi:hypothetical protein